MRITFVLPRLFHNGGNRVIAIYAEHLLSNGHCVSVVSGPCRPMPMRRRIKRRLGLELGQRPYVPAPVFDHLKDQMQLIMHDRLLRHDDVPAADLVVATWWDTAPFVMSLGTGKGAKVYFIQGDERFAAPRPAAVETTWRYPMSRIAVSQWLVDTVRPYVRGGSLELVHNAVDTNMFQAAPRHRQHKPAVGFVLADIAIKGSDLAVQAAKLARLRLPSLSLKAFGYAADVHKFSLPAGSTYLCRPTIDQIIGMYSSVDAWLFPSRKEGFGLPILEAMACRTPVIAMPAGAAPQLLAAGGGVLLPDHDPAVMAGAIEQVCTASQAVWAKLSDRAYETAKRHSWPLACQRVEAALTRAAEASD